MEVVAKHLGAPDGDTVVRALHLTCRQHRAAARFTLQQLALHRCYHHWAYRQPGLGAHARYSVPPVPLGFISGCLRATGWTLQVEQLAVFDEDVLEQLAAATARVRRLEVVGSHPAHPGLPGQPQHWPQLVGLGRLLRACTQLAQVHSCGGLAYSDSSVHLIWDPDNTSSSSSSSSSNRSFGPPLSLQCWESLGLPADLVLRWIQQQPQPQQLRHTLTRLSLRDSGDRVDVSPLTAVKGLRELEVTHPTRESLMQLSSCSSLTHLRVGALQAVQPHSHHSSSNSSSMWCYQSSSSSSSSSVWCYQSSNSSSSSMWNYLSSSGSRVWEPAAEAVCGLTSLQRLVLEGEEPLLPRSFSSLKQLTCLVASGGKLKGMPPDLGVWCPRLVRLVAGTKPEGPLTGLLLVPASLTRLTHLNIGHSTGTRVKLQGNLPHLQELILGPSYFSCIVGLSKAPNLQLLDVRDSSALKGSLDALQPLTALRHLNFDRYPGMHPDSFEAMDLRQQDYARYNTSFIHPNYEPYPSINPASFSVIGALQQLTSLSASGCTAAAWGALAAAPPLRSLLELSLETSDDYGALAALGPWLAQLTALTSFRMAGRRRMVEEEGGGRGMDEWFCKAHAQEVLVFPCGLRHLDLSCVDWRTHRLPRGLLRLTALEVLHIRVPWRGLPTWFTKLQRLQALALFSSADPRHWKVQERACSWRGDPRPVVRQMLGLRVVQIEGQPPHLDEEGSGPWEIGYWFDQRTCSSAVNEPIQHRVGDLPDRWYRCPEHGPLS